MKRLNRNKKFNKTMILLFAIMFVGLGFAALSATLGINGFTMIGHIRFDVHFENISVNEGSMEAEMPATINKNNNTQIDFSLELTTPGTYYEFEVDIVNGGTLDAYLSSIELLGLDDAAQKYLEVTYNYINDDKPKVDDLLLPGETERIKVRVEFKYDITDNDLPAIGTKNELGLRLDYVQDNGIGKERDEDAIYVNILGQDMIAYIDNKKSKHVSSETGIDFSVVPSDENGKGLYLRAGTEGDEFPIFYFRGGDDQDGDGVEDYLNNHVLFGGFCWKIVRTTELGGIKLIYDGVPDSNNQCHNTGRASQTGTAKFNFNYTSLADVGYMYGTRYSYTSWDDATYPYVYGSDVTYSNGAYTLVDASDSDIVANIKTKHYTCKLTTNEACSTIYYVYSYYQQRVYAIALTNGYKLEDIISNSYTNKNNSSIKSSIDNWFASNLKGQEDKLEDAVWCNDRSITSGGYLDNSDLTTLLNGYTYFGGYTRNASAYKPGLKNEDACPNKDDRFTKRDILNGNGALEYPVGLITGDEATVAGHGYSVYSETSYLNTGEWYWTMSPPHVAHYGYFSDMFVVQSVGWLGTTDVSMTSRGVRPAVVLKKGIVATSGDGSSSNPYIVE